jgi:hypothetical protein
MTKKKVASQPKSKRKPTHEVFVVTDDIWEPVGAAWEHGDGRGLFIKILGKGNYQVRKR